MDVTAVLNTLLHGNQLKRTARTGWAQRGVPNAENVAAHSFGVVFVALVLAQVVEETLDLGRLLAIAALHEVILRVLVVTILPYVRHEDARVADHRQVVHLLQQARL